LVTATALFFGVLDHTAAAYQVPVICVFTEVTDSQSKPNSEAKKKTYFFENLSKVYVHNAGGIRSQ